jgi:hypothetical protein
MRTPNPNRETAQIGDSDLSPALALAWLHYARQLADKH